MDTRDHFPDAANISAERRAEKVGLVGAAGSSASYTCGLRVVEGVVEHRGAIATDEDRSADNYLLVKAEE
jgi:hypothetical protein